MNDVDKDARELLARLRHEEQVELRAIEILKEEHAEKQRHLPKKATFFERLLGWCILGGIIIFIAALGGAYD
ncbi:hypothetical protein [Mesorhizobium sp. CAU 1741]|uniref:hypothetical protein n=1 Tax=Mesorhizobium sp. CAU 1741 TaxID=3140366 RepID=UPI00325C2C7A